MAKGIKKSASSTDKRGEVLALGSGLFCLLAALGTGALGAWTGSHVVWAIALQVGGSVGIWFLCWIQLHQLRLLAEERLEVADLERQRHDMLGGAQTIFDEEDLDQMDKLAMGRRLRSIERYLVPIVAIIVAAYHAIVGLALLPWTWSFPPLVDAYIHSDRQIQIGLFVMLGLSFAFFMLSRFAIGMSRLNNWSALRAGGNFMFGASVASIAAMVALIPAATSDYTNADNWVTWGIGGLLLVLAAETIVNFIMDFYRPRIAGQVQRPFYDSRLLGIFSEPGGILRSLANAIDYQFGFKVSETWVYKLLGRTLPLLIILQALVILGLTTIVIVPPGHRAVIERYGRALADVATPGIHLALPWPIDQAFIIPVERIRRMELGHDTHVSDPNLTSGLPMLWTSKHYAKEYKLLVADRQASDTMKVPVNLLSLNMPLQWRVKPENDQVLRFYRQAMDVDDIIESLAYSELTRHAASSDIFDLLGERGTRLSRTLTERIQARCDAAGDDGRGLGVEIVMVGIGGVHPPFEDEVAQTYEDVVNAFEQRDAAIKSAEGDAAQKRVEAAGEQWNTLYDAIAEEDRLRLASDPGQAAQTETVDRMLSSVVGGVAREKAARAQEATYGRVVRERASAERYAVELSVFQIARHVFTYRTYLRMLEEGLQSVRKYVVAVERPERVLYELDLKPPTGLDIMGAEMKATESGEAK